MSKLLDEAAKHTEHGNSEAAVQLIQQHFVEQPNDLQGWHRASIMAESLGNNELARTAHFKCISLAPNLAIAYIYAGSWLINSNKDAAASAFSLAYDLQPERFLSLSRYADNAATYDKTRLGAEFLCDFLKDMHLDACIGSDRVAKASWVRTDALKPNFENTSGDSRPELFKLETVRQLPFYDPSELGWSEELVEAKESILEELMKFVGSSSLKDQARPYLDSGSVMQGPLSDLAGSSKWTAIDLFRDGEIIKENADHFPKTLSALKQIPTYSLDGAPFEVFFSLLQADQEIAPHYGLSNHSLTVHLPLITNDEGYLEVNSIKRKWSEISLIAFDDTFLHSAHNIGPKERVVLIFSVWHPDLSLDDREAIQKSFSQRSRWLSERYQKVLASLSR